MRRELAISRLALLASGAFFALGLSIARADPTDVFGFGARSPALGNATTASDDSLSAAIDNPAAAVQARTAGLELGYSYAALALRLNHRAPGLPDSHGIWGAATLPFHVGSVRLAITSALYVPDAWLVRDQLLAPTEPRLVMWDSGTSRTVLSFALAVALGTRVSLGLGASVLFDAVTHRFDIGIDTTAGRARTDADLDASLPFRAAPVAGVLVTPIDHLRVGVRYAGALSLETRVSESATVHVDGTTIDGDLLASLRGVDHYSPHRIAFGAAADLGRTTLLAAIEWQAWSHMPSAGSDVRVVADLGVPVRVEPTSSLAPGYHDVFVPRVGIEERVPLPRDRTLSLRAGWSFVPSPVPAQTGLTSYADSDRHAFGLGAALSFRAFDVAMQLELGLSVIWLVPRSAIKDSLVSPGGDVTSSGTVWAGSFGWRVGT